MSKFEKFVGYLSEIVLVTQIFLIAAWFLFGKVTVTVAYGGKAVNDGVVYLDDEIICMSTPCVFRPLPGYHRIEATLPRGYSNCGRSYWYSLRLGDLGGKFEAEFDVPKIENEAR